MIIVTFSFLLHSRKNVTDKQFLKILIKKLPPDTSAATLFHKCYSSVYLGIKGGATARKYSIKAALRSRRNGTKFAVSLLAKLLIKCRRLPRGFLWNTSLPSLVDWLFYFWKVNIAISYEI